MNLCEDGHDEVCYEARNCPACEALSEKDKEINILEKIIEDLKDEIESMKEGEL